MTSKISVNLLLTPLDNDQPCKVTINDEVLFDDTLTSPQTISGEITQSEVLDIKIESNS